MSVEEVDIREPIDSDARLDTQDGWGRLLATLRALRERDGSDRTDYGAFARPTGALATGLAIGSVPVAVGVRDDPLVAAHEIGHTLSLSHAPCGTGGDPAYPHPVGAIDHFGYNTRTGDLFGPDTPDLMSYCSPRWISDYHYLKILTFRDPPLRAKRAPRGEAAPREAEGRAPRGRRPPYEIGTPTFRYRPIQSRIRPM